jgi:hypothetical protein
MLGVIRQSLNEVPDHRKGRNTQYEITDAGLSALSVFYMQSSSFLAYQRHMEQQQGRNNARSLFGVKEIPSDGQIRNLLDPVDPSALRTPFWDVFDLLHACGHLDQYQHVGETLLLSVDGTRHFSSKKIHCPRCTTYDRETGTEYAHLVLVPVLVAPGDARVIALEPEFITPQDGHDKQDSEQQALKRWVMRNAGRFGEWRVTILTDDLHSHQPLCELLLAHKMHFIMTAKVESHAALYQEVELLSRVAGGIQTMVVRHWNGRHYEQHHYRWAERVPLRADVRPLHVNWCEVTILREDTGKQIYHNAWVTSHELSPETVPEVMAAGRAHWKVENETFNVLKNQGYHFEHNYGHGKEHLSTVLLTLLLLAFLMHTALQLSSAEYQAIRQALGVRRTFFDDLRALTRYCYFQDWDALMNFMCQQLELKVD